MINNQDPKSESDRPSGRVHRAGFTLIEVLVSIGIIVLLTGLLLGGLAITKKRASEIRVHSDLALIATALEAYKSDNNGQYPVFADALTDQAANAAAVPGNGNWLDTDSWGVRGAALLCRALIGPGPGNTSTNSGGGFPPNPGDDGADGPGFRARLNVTNSNGAPVLYGKVYGPYLDASKFKIGYINQSPTKTNNNYPMEYPVIFEGSSGDWIDPFTQQAIGGSPVLYYPAAPGNPTKLLDYSDPLKATVNVTSRFNGYDNFYLVSASSDATTLDPALPFAVLAAQCGTPNYLLWTAGADGVFGLVNGKTDDVANFDFPLNLKK